MAEPQENGKSPMTRWIVLAVAVLLAIGGCRFLFGRPVFDPEEVARAETRMWQAYYSNDRMRLGLELVRLLRNQHGLTLMEAKQIGEQLAASAMKFKGARGNYAAAVLPELTKTYALIKGVSGGSFDPGKAAEAELAWWVARRTPGEDFDEDVGEKIAELYAILYGSDRPEFHEAGLLRAEAAGLRDRGQSNADWRRIEALLLQSYRTLEKGL